MAYLSLKGINKIYPNGFHAVHDFNLDIEKGVQQVASLSVKPNGKNQHHGGDRKKFKTR